MSDEGVQMISGFIKTKSDYMNYLNVAQISSFWVAEYTASQEFHVIATSDGKHYPIEIFKDRKEAEDFLLDFLDQLSPELDPRQANELRRPY
jgi:hypothetical protein